MTIAETRLSRVLVADVMNTGILTTDPSTPLPAVARLMASRHVHAVAVADPTLARRPLTFVTALDITRAAAAEDDELTAGQAASTEILAVRSDESISVAARLMSDHASSHLIVVEPRTGHPCGLISSLDIAAAYGA